LARLRPELRRSVARKARLRPEGAGLTWLRPEGAGLTWLRPEGAGLTWLRPEGAGLTWLRPEGAGLHGRLLGPESAGRLRGLAWDRLRSEGRLRLLRLGSARERERADERQRRERSAPGPVGKHLPKRMHRASPARSNKETPANRDGGDLARGPLYHSGRRVKQRFSLTAAPRQARRTAR
jgi:hypothetical protein